MAVISCSSTLCSITRSTFCKIVVPVEAGFLSSLAINYPSLRSYFLKFHVMNKSVCEIKYLSRLWPAWKQHAVIIVFFVVVFVFNILQPIYLFLEYCMNALPGAS